MRKFVPKKMRFLPPEATRVFQGVIFDVYQWDQEMFDGSLEIFEMLKRDDVVQVIAINQDKIVILEQEQPSLGFFYSLPGGRHDHTEEDELQAAKRELREETGMELSNWKLISAVQPYQKIEYVVYTFIATDVIKQGEQKLDVGEKITITHKTFEEVKELGRNPQAREMATQIFSRVDSLRELLALPECV